MSDEKRLTATQMAAVEALIAAMKPIADGQPFDDTNLHDACTAMEDLYAEEGVTHPDVFKLRQELKKAGFNRPPKVKP